MYFTDIILNYENTKSTPIKEELFYLQFFYFFLLFFAPAIKLDEVLPEISKPKLIIKSDWTPEEKTFFNIANFNTLIKPGSVVMRSDEVPDLLIEVYNKLVIENEVDSFIYRTARRIGYPVWLGSAIENSRDTFPDIIYIPFVQRDSSHISGYLIAYKDNADSNSELRIDIRLRYDMIQIKLQQQQMTSNTSHDILRFRSLDSLLFQNSGEFYDELLEEALYEEREGFNGEVRPRSCESEEAIFCYWREGEGGGIEDGLNSDWTITSNPFNTWCCSWTFYFWTPVPGGGGSGGRPGWITPTLIFDVSPIIPPRAFSSNPVIETRTVEYICAPYVVIRCYNGKWWEIVAEIPCNNCDVDLELQIAEEAFCNEEASSFATTTMGFTVGPWPEGAEYRRAFFQLINVATMAVRIQTVQKNPIWHLN